MELSISILFLALFLSVQYPLCSLTSQTSRTVPRWPQAATKPSLSMEHSGRKEQVPFV